MWTLVLVAALCIALVIITWRWEVEKEGREQAETDLYRREGLWCEEVLRLRAWLEYIRTDSALHTYDTATPFALMVGVPELCTRALTTTEQPHATKAEQLRNAITDAYDEKLRRSVD